MAATDDTRKTGEIASVLPLGTANMTKYEKTGVTATESPTEAPMPSVGATKVELPVYQEMTGLKTAVEQLTPILERLPQNLHNVATAKEKAERAVSKLNSRKDDEDFALILAVSGFKTENLESNMTSAAKKAVNVDVASIRQVIQNIREATLKIEEKYGTKEPAGKATTTKASDEGKGNITDNNKPEIRNLLLNRGYDEIDFTLQDDGEHYRVTASKSGGKIRSTLFTTNVERQWL